MPAVVGLLSFDRLRWVLACAALVGALAGVGGYLLAFFCELPVGACQTGIAAGCVLVFTPADHTHRAWRLAVVQGLARQYAPVRVNAVAADDEKAITAATDYLAGAGGITGQYLPLDGNGAEALLSLTR